jgi:L-2-hydroxyglutarate oxidase LhgO
MKRQDAIRHLEPTLQDRIDDGNGNLVEVNDDVIYSPTTASMDTVAGLRKVESMLPDKVETIFGQRFNKIESETDSSVTFSTDTGDKHECRFLINSAGQNALDIARSCGFGDSLMQFQMKGMYTMSETPIAKDYKMHVYPVPIPGAQNLGVHTTLAANGHVKVGPSVLPAFAAENYNGLENVTMGSFAEACRTYLTMIKSN